MRVSEVTYLLRSDINSLVDHELGVGEEGCDTKEDLLE